ncbi:MULTISPECIES: ABC transporter permease [Ruminococcus]|uniref:Binding-protein-dependent transport systems inner membrane component n=1 Tax=Ruminococcus albus (strain ATCC 27210 / DSM 20455 / JCM 14654 / NCDO 2250 / 7) TaxID=697329 RepID=E6UGK3_RUMA7|nr:MULTISPECIES: ABC transporter permease subunit [Ruminococcus]ADU23126.1 binding-protein-dependent transport systems inner membrane component [Ruminococcus albus 7 = DSM 20455]MCR5021341.1 ABC transporter permease subunit [Ruminococcus sp.]
MFKDPDFGKKLRNQKSLLLLSIPFVIYALIFFYTPLFGWIMAFQKYKPRDGFLHSQFVGLDNFKFLFRNEDFLLCVRNTLAMGLINLVLGTICPIVFAILLSELRFKIGKNVVQTISYLPHFLSMIILTGIVFDVLSMENGTLNKFLIAIGAIDKPIQWLADPKYFWWIVGFANRWKETGWDSIIYLAAITSINPDLYEAASIDGAGRMKRIWHITLPGLKPTILILLIMNVGNVLNVGFELQYLLGNDLVKSVAETIDIYVLNYGISKGNYSIGIAAGIFKSLVSIILVIVANTSAKLMGEESLY